MVLHINAPEIADANTFKNIFITTKNNAGENTPAKVNITISRLQTPAQSYRKRFWQQPDQFVMNKQMFASYFPFDEYEKESDYHEWKKEKVVVKDTFNTSFTSNYKLPATGLLQGWYCIEASAKDKDSNEVKDVRYVQIYNMNTPGLSSPQIAFSQVINNSGSVGDKAQLLLGTSEQDVFAITNLKRSSSKASDSFGYVKLSNNKKQIDYTIQPSDNGNIGLYYAFIKHNNFYKGGMQVYVNNTAQQLNITYATYRNKTEPGSKEKWTVQVMDSSNKMAPAELLTSMYDASLDQFKKQQWEVPYLKPYSYVNNEWKGGDFAALGSDENMDHQSFYSVEKDYNHLAKSANELWRIYQSERYKRMVMSRFANPKIMADEEANGRLVQHMKIPTPYALEGKASGLSVGSLSEVVVTGYGAAKRKDITGSLPLVTIQNLSNTSSVNLKIRGITGISNINTILVIIDGVVSEKKLDEIDASSIDHIDVVKGSEATALYGAKAANGAIIITTKDYALRNGKRKEETPQVQIRKNFTETAFFFPQLHADSSGNYSFSFTMPDAVTTWKWMSLAHTKSLAFGYKQQSIVTQKTLMVQPNLPRFLREGDKIAITAKISNLSDSILQGNASLQMLDAITLQPLNDSFHIASSQKFSAEANRSTIITFPVSVPLNFTHPVTVKIITVSSGYSDGEEDELPVLSNRTLVTETAPFFMLNTGTKTIHFAKLINNHSASLSNESLTVEYTPNPIWSVVHSLPYLIQFPHECAEQTFNRFYANILAAYVVAKHPKIKQVFEKWKADSLSSGEGRGEVLQSNLEQNPELTNILLNETPWVADAKTEVQQRRNIVLLFDAAKVSNGAASALNQLKEMQMDNGAFAWFKGGYADRYITQYILTGIGKLNKLHTVATEEQNTLNEIVEKGLGYLDKEEEKEYAQLIKNKADVSRNQLSQQGIQYWYMRSFFGNDLHNISTGAFSFFVKQTEQYWTNETPYMQGMIAISLDRLLGVIKSAPASKITSLKILRSLKENAVTDSTKGMYWKDNESGYYWYQSPVEAQASLIDVFTEITPRDPAINAMRQWLILNKQTHHWETTKATADACFALLNNNETDSSQNVAVTFQIGDSTIAIPGEKQQAGSGYTMHRIDGKNITPSMGNVSVSVESAASENHAFSPSYGAVYWRYFEDMDKVTAAASSLSVTKNLFVEKNSDKGKILQSFTDHSMLKTGDKVIIRLVIKNDRDLEYVQLTDTRAAAMEPVNVLSAFKWQDGLGYYESTKDASTNFFIDHLAKGTYVFEYPVYITHTGNFSSGIATLQCMYAPAFAAHSAGVRIQVEAAK